MKSFVLSVYILCVLRSFVDADCDIISKKEWGGLRPSHVEYLPRPVDLAIIQHTATPNCTTDRTCRDRVRSIEDYHVNDRKYWEIGPSFLIGGTGKVYEGSGWIHVGAHTYGYNIISIGIAFIGNFNDDEPTAQALAAAQALLKCGVEKGHLTSNYKLVGHKQLIAIESPGRYLYNEMRTWSNWLEDTESLKPFLR